LSSDVGHEDQGECAQQRLRLGRMVATVMARRPARAQVAPHLPADEEQQQAPAEDEAAAARLQQADGENREDAEQHHRAREPQQHRQMPLAVG
jgi:hypothetical protein